MGSTLSDQHARPSDSPQSSTSPTRLAAAIGGLALVVFAAALTDDSFVDEYAYITQSYYADHFFRGEFNHPDWLDLPAFDLPPLPKYLIGFSLRAAHLPMPGPRHALEWYGNHHMLFGTPATLTVARLPFLALGTLGCVALFGCGVMIKDGRTGVLAAVLLMVNPLFRLHAHRAMSEAPYEAFLIAALALGLWAGHRVWAGRSDLTSWLGFGLAGVCAGLSIASKFTGFLGWIVIACWCVFALAAPRLPALRKLALAAGATAIPAVALGVVVAVNPALTARPRGNLLPEARSLAKLDPWQRFHRMVEIRLAISRNQKANFSHNALTTWAEQAKVFAVQGFGRFSPFGPRKSDSKIRYDVRQDLGVIFWAPLVLIGLVQALGMGRIQYRRGAAPTAWALVIWAVVAWVVVASYLPMAWDRYLLPIQAPNALLAAVAVSRLWVRVQGPIVAAWRRMSAPALGVFAILLGSYAFFWHTRDWNTASRLMLTYALVDRGTVAITGLEKQTRDLAWFQGQYYSDKFPGYSLLATIPYAYAKWAFDLPAHQLDVPAMFHWQADYWITLGTSGLLTACTGALLVLVARDLGCRPAAAVLTGLAYGLATPAYVYATLAYGHQAAAFALFGSFVLLWRDAHRREALRMVLAGFLAAYAAVIELQVGPVSAILALYLLAQCSRGGRRGDRLGLFALGALLPTLLLLGYNQLAFGSPWDTGYNHEVVPDFARVHNVKNPFGLRSPDWTKLDPLLWGSYRGLFFYAPVLLATVPGWMVLLRRRRWDAALVSMLVVAAVLLVNLSYPEWTGGWSTGPRLLVPLIPFAMIGVAGLMACPAGADTPPAPPLSRGGKGKGAPASFPPLPREGQGGFRVTSRVTSIATVLVAGLALAGGIEMLLFQGVGARIPQSEPDPFGIVCSLWKEPTPLPAWCNGERFCHNLVSQAIPGGIARLAPRWQFLQFLPLVLAQGLAILALWRFGTVQAGSAPSVGPRSD